MLLFLLVFVGISGSQSSPLSTGGTSTYPISVIADQDKASKVDTYSWASYLKKGNVSYNMDEGLVSVSWEDPVVLKSGYSSNGRGMELSELITFYGKVLTCDDKTGIIYEVLGKQVIPWVILSNDHLFKPNGLKCEWATIKDGNLLVGSNGQEWVSDKGELQNEDGLYVKTISRTGEVDTLIWIDNYKKIRELSAGIKFPGYMTHEAVAWSEHHKKWFFLPRRCSNKL